MVYSKYPPCRRFLGMLNLAIMQSMFVRQIPESLRAKTLKDIPGEVLGVTWIQIFLFLPSKILPV